MTTEPNERALVEAMRAAIRAENHSSIGDDLRQAQAALAAHNAWLKAQGFVVVPGGEPASMWRNAVSNTVALIDIVRRRHTIAATNKAFAVFDCDLNGALDDWFKATRNAKPESYDEAEKVWKDFAASPLAGGE